MSRKLLSDAIADAKLVKKTAIANAKVALEEAFRPTIAGLVSNKIREEEGDEFETEDDVHIDVNYGHEGCEMEVGEEEDGGVGFGSFDGGDEEVPAEEPVVPEEGEEDMELESLIRELEGEDDEYLGEEFEDDEMMEEDASERWAEPPVPEVGDNDPVIEVLINELEGEEDDLMESEHGGGSYEESGPSERGMNTEGLRRKLRQKTKDLNEAYSVITKLKTVVNEVNLLNAKLMYTTKALRQNPYLSEAQQNKVMDAIDRGNTVREVKLVYAAIVEGFKRSNSPKRKMVEGLASRATPVLNPGGKQKLSEDVIRWQELAGLRKLRD